MKLNAFLIRTAKNSNRVNLIVNNLKKYRNIDYYIIEENYNESATSYLKEDNYLILGSDYLEKTNLQKIKNTGWQCGDYIAYAGMDYFPNYKYYWVMDDDLYLNLDINKFIEKTDLLEIDCIATDFGKRNPSWFWYKTLSNEFKDIYGMRYPLVRLSNKAIDFLKKKRSEYHPQLKENECKDLFANDECFTGTYLKNNNFSCDSFQNLVVFPKVC